MEQLIVKHRQMLAQHQTLFSRPLMNSIHWNERMIGIKGARGVGKTTLCMQYIKKTFDISPQCLYVSMDDVAFPYPSLIVLAQQFVQRGGKYLFVDEIHKYPDWIRELKNIYDTYPTLHVVFTGSSVMHLDHSKADLSRRAVMYNMRGLSFREFLQIETGMNLPCYTLQQIIHEHETITYQIVEKLKPLQYFDNYLRYGYYPYYLQNTETYHFKLSALINQIIETDLPLLAHIDVVHIAKLKRFFYLLSEFVPFKPNLVRLGEIMQLSRQTVSNYIHLLAQAGLLQLLYPESKNLSALAKPEKMLLQHPNYYYALSRYNANVGSIRETFFVNQLAAVHTVETAEQGDFCIDGCYTFEIGGASKSFAQIAHRSQSYLAVADTDIGIGNKIPLWLFGFLY